MLALHVALRCGAMCAGAIAHARIARLYYGADDPKGGAVVHGPRVFAQPTVHHRPEIYDGIGAGEAAALLRDFFAARRGRKMCREDTKRALLRSHYACRRAGLSLGGRKRKK